MPNDDNRVRLSVHKEGIPCLFLGSSVFWLVLSLSDQGPGRLIFFPLNLSSLACGCSRDLGSLVPEPQDGA